MVPNQYSRTAKVQNKCLFLNEATEEAWQLHSWQFLQFGWPFWNRKEVKNNLSTRFQLSHVAINCTVVFTVISETLKTCIENTQKQALNILHQLAFQEKQFLPYLQSCVEMVSFICYDSFTRLKIRNRIADWLIEKWSLGNSLFLAI